MSREQFPDSLQSPDDLGLIWQRAIVGRDAAGKSWLEFPGTRDCARCLAGKGCGAGLFSRLFGERRHVLQLTLPEQLRSGAPVKVGIDAQSLMRVAALMYLLPVLAFIAGAAAAHFQWPGHDGAGLLAGLGLAGLAWLLVARRYGPRGLSCIKVMSEGLESGACGNHLNDNERILFRNKRDPVAPRFDPPGPPD